LLAMSIDRNKYIQIDADKLPESLDVVEIFAARS
jgi:hypothetical protein